MTLRTDAPARVDSSVGRRLGLVAHYSRSNYGNHLVNFAVKRALESCGYEVDLIVFEGGVKQMRVSSARRLPKKIVRLVRDGDLPDRVRRRLRRTTASASERPRAGNPLRLARFQEFSDEHLQPRFCAVGSRSDLVGEYARFAVGSDQIWNYDYGLGPWHFLDFAEPQSCVCICPSVGHRLIPLEWRAFYQRNLSRQCEVGVRELEWTTSLPALGAEPVYTLLPDPTLTVPSEEWQRLAHVPPGFRGGVLLYELGDMSRPQKDFVEELSSFHGLAVDHLSERVQGPLWQTNASEFLGMISAASCVVTDSYHGAIFSFLFDKPLVILRRHGFAGSMNSRIETLVRELHLEGRLIENLRPSEALNYDYSSGRAALLDLRASFWKYLARHQLTPVPDEQSASRQGD